MNIKLSLLFLYVFSYNISTAQQLNDQKKSAISLELGKSGLIYNLSYDQKIANTPFGFRALVGTNFAQYLHVFNIGGGVYYLLGNSKHFFELGADVLFLKVEEVSNDQIGFAFVYPDFSVKTIYPSMNIGYRRYGQNTLFRMGVAPGLIKQKFITGGYLSLGVLF